MYYLYRKHATAGFIPEPFFGLGNHCLVTTQCCRQLVLESNYAKDQIFSPSSSTIEMMVRSGLLITTRDGTDVISAEKDSVPSFS